MSDCMCIMAPVSSVGRDGTGTRHRDSEAKEEERRQLPGIRIEAIVIVDKYVCIRMEIDKSVSLCLWVPWPSLMFAVLCRGVSLDRVAGQAQNRVYTLASRAVTLVEGLCVGM